LALYRGAIRTAGAAAGAAFAALRSGAGKRLYVREIGFYLANTNALSLGIVRAATVGTASASLPALACDPADAAGTGTLDSAWSTAPTIGTAFLDRVTLPGAAGAGLILPYSRGELVVPASGSLLLWNVGSGAGPALDVHFVWEE
jgi:hypothetical protein